MHIPFMSSVYDVRLFVRSRLVESGNSADNGIMELREPSGTDTSLNVKSTVRYKGSKLSNYLADSVANHNPFHSSRIGSVSGVWGCLTRNDYCYELDLLSLHSTYVCSNGRNGTTPTSPG